MGPYEYFFYREMSNYYMNTRFGPSMEFPINRGFNTPKTNWSIDKSMAMNEV